MTSHFSFPFISLAFLTNFFNSNLPPKVFICSPDSNFFRFLEIDRDDWGKYSQKGAFIFAGDTTSSFSLKDFWCNNHDHPSEAPEFSAITGLIAVAVSGGGFFALRRRFA